MPLIAFVVLTEAWRWAVVASWYLVRVWNGVCLVEPNLDLFSAIQGRPKNGTLTQGCPFGVAGSDWGFQGSVAACHPGVRESI